MNIVGVYLLEAKQARDTARKELATCNAESWRAMAEMEKSTGVCPWKTQAMPSDLQRRSTVAAGLMDRYDWADTQWRATCTAASAVAKKASVQPSDITQYRM